MENRQDSVRISECNLVCNNAERWTIQSYATTSGMSSLYSQCMSITHRELKHECTLHNAHDAWCVKNATGSTTYFADRGTTMSDMLSYLFMKSV